MKTHQWILGLVSLALAASPLAALENEAARRDQLKRLRGAIRAYAELNGGKAPARISQLLDENLVEGPGALMRPGSSAVPERAELDARSDYTLESLADVADIVVRERSTLAGEGEVLAILKDGTIKALAIGGGTRGPPPPAVDAPRPTPNRTMPPPSSPRTTPPVADDDVAPGGASIPLSTMPGTTRPPPRIAPVAAADSPPPAPTRRSPPPPDDDVAPGGVGVSLSTQPIASRGTPRIPPAAARDAERETQSASASFGEAARVPARRVPPAAPPVNPDGNNVAASRSLPTPAGTASRSLETARGSSARGAPTEEEAATMAQATRILQQRAEAESVRETVPAGGGSAGASGGQLKQAATRIGDWIAGRPITPAGSSGQRQVRIEDLPPAGLTPAPAPNRPVVEFNRAPTRTPETIAEFNRWLKLAQAAEAQGDVVTARGHYQMAVGLQPDSIEALAGLAQAHNREGDVSEGVLKYLTLQAHAPATPGLALKLAELYVGMEDLARGRREAQRALAAQPDSALALSWLATVEMFEGDRNAARARFQKAAQLDPKVIEQRYQNIEWMLHSGQARRAAVEAVSVLMMNPEHRGALFAAGDAYAQLDNRERAVGYFQRYLELDGQSEWAARARQKLAELGAPAAISR